MQKIKGSDELGGKKNNFCEQMSHPSHRSEQADKYECAAHNSTGLCSAVVVAPVQTHSLQMFYILTYTQDGKYVKKNHTGLLHFKTYLNVTHSIASTTCLCR